MADKHTYTKNLRMVKLLTCPLNEFEDAANQMLARNYEPIGSVSTVLENKVIICTQLWGLYDYVDEKGDYHDNPWEEEDHWKDDDYWGDD